MVHYCNVACKKKHKSKHKKKCERRVAELHDEALFKEPPVREDCPICFLPLPIDARQIQFKSCCGKIICGGCTYIMAIEDMKKGKKKVDWGMCAFCRTLTPSSGKETVERLKRQIEKGNASALYNFASCYASGIYGMPQDWAKANELLLKAGELGCAEAYSKLGYSYEYGRGVEADKKKAKHYYEIAAMKGDEHARHNLGALEGKACNFQRRYKHYVIAAKAGYRTSMEYVKKGFRSGHVTKDEYESTLRVYHELQTEMKSDMRADAIAFHHEWS